ncbi:TetR/AcrR family transcriptional regulator [Secundilactobacillus mixtipabuli]|uniref:TetR family transcriptional regulator n=1 Tax=Secundilactobacillus mixtipabuli TaxID=1435342 RepID=A0A1Z5I9R2_9LACO|nr:helix-turn-helix domain-containing protein [Secundilactobacillus mixtipabuli]GAW98489.1 TetR family transcriptional regulator [Secundilactobacillus mixtipabuli]
MDTKNQILKAAYKLFQEKSYDETSVTDICDACHLTKPAFYYHFAAKSDLLLSFYKSTVEKLVLTIDVSDTNYWRQLVMCFVHLAQAENKLGADIISKVFIANLAQNQHTFDFNDSFKNTCVTLITKAQESKQIKATQDPTELFYTASYIFTGYDVMWAIEREESTRINGLISSFSNLFNVSEEAEFTL